MSWLGNHPAGCAFSNRWLNLERHSRCKVDILLPRWALVSHTDDCWIPLWAWPAYTHCASCTYRRSDTPQLSGRLAEILRWLTRTPSMKPALGTLSSSEGQSTQGWTIHRNDHKSYISSLPKTFAPIRQARVGFVASTAFGRALISTTEAVWSLWLLAG